MFIHPINASTEVTNVDDAMIQPNTIDLRVNRVFKIGGGPMHMDENTKKHRKSIEVLPDEDGNYLLDQGTCYDPDEEGRSCGRCPSCAERIKAFANIQEIDPIPYQTRHRKGD